MREGFPTGLHILFGFLSSHLGFAEVFEVFLYVQSPTILQTWWKLMVDIFEGWKARVHA